MQILDLSTMPAIKAVTQAVTVLSNGGLVIFPTETVYGAGVDATNQSAVNKLLAYKSRREGKPLSIAVSNKKMAEQYVVLTDQANSLYNRFLPGPVTVVSQGRGVVAKGVESEFGTLGVRIPDYPLITRIVTQLHKPITATSANGSGQKRPYTIDDIFDGLSEKQRGLVDLVLDAGRLPPREPSTVIDTTLSTPTTLRQGDLDLTPNTADSTTLTSKSVAETQKIAGTLLLKYWDSIKKTGLVIGLDGALGTGKTTFTKGVGQFLQISDTITSPTYSYIEEYDFSRHGVHGRLYHLDLWKIDTHEEAERLGISQLLAPNTVIVIEWWQQTKEYIEQIVASQQVAFFSILFKQTGRKQRQLMIHQPK